jgi:cell division protein FtsL
MRTAVLLAVPGVFLAAFGLLALEHANRGLEAVVDERQARREWLENEVVGLEIERARLATPARIEAHVRAGGPD